MASERRARLGVPASASLSAIRGAIGRFGALVVRRVGIGRAPAVAAVLSLTRPATTSPRPSSPDDALHTRRGRCGWRICPPPSSRSCSSPRRAAPRQIAQQLHYSEQNVGYHLHQLIRKMHVRNRTALVARAVKYGLITVTDD